MMKFAILAASAIAGLGLSTAIAGGKGSSGHSSGSHSSHPPGHYAGGVGSSHKGGHYKNSYTNDHYQKRTPSHSAVSNHFSSPAHRGHSTTISPPAEYFSRTNEADAFGPIPSQVGRAGTSHYGDPMIDKDGKDIAEILPGNRPPAAPASAAEVERFGPSDAEVYAAARKALDEGRTRAMSKDLSLRSKAMQVNREAAIRKVAEQYNIHPEELYQIIAAGEEGDGTAAKKRKGNAKARAQEVLGELGAQIQADAAAQSARSAAQYQADVNLQLRTGRVR